MKFKYYILKKLKSKKFFLIISLILIQFITFSCINKGNEVYLLPQTISFQKTVNINNFINLLGEECNPNPINQQTQYDLNFFYINSSTEAGLRGGYYKDENNIWYYLKILDLGEINFEILDEVPAINDYNAKYTNVKTNLLTNNNLNQITILKLNHVYSIYKWSKYGGNYLKLIIDEINFNNGNISIRGVYQKREGYNKFY